MEGCRRRSGFFSIPLLWRGAEGGVVSFQFPSCGGVPKAEWFLFNSPPMEGCRRRSGFFSIPLLWRGGALATGWSPRLLDASIPNLNAAAPQTTPPRCLTPSRSAYSTVIRTSIPSDITTARHPSTGGELKPKQSNHSGRVACGMTQRRFCYRYTYTITVNQWTYS